MNIESLKNFWITLKIFFYYIQFNILKSIYSSEQFKIIFFQKISKINIIYIKFIQYYFSFGCNTDSSNEINESLRKYCDDVPFTISNDYKEFILKSIENSNNNNNLKINLESLKLINSGIISFVYKCEDLQKNKYVIKILKENIERDIEEGINQIRQIHKIYMNNEKLFNTILDPSGNNTHINSKLENYNTLLTSITEKLKVQTNFDFEKKNISLFNKKTFNTNYIVTPSVHDIFNNDKMILMDFISNTELSEFKLIEKCIFAKLFIKSIIKFLLFDGIFHDDLHFGNIRFIKEKINNTNQEDVSDDNVLDNYIYKIGLIDFGMIGVLNNEEKEMYLKIIKLSFIEEYEELVTLILKNWVVNDTDNYNFQNNIYDFISNEEISEYLKSKDFKDAITELNNLKQKRLYSFDFLFNINKTLGNKKWRIHPLLYNAGISLALSLNFVDYLCDGNSHNYFIVEDCLVKYNIINFNNFNPTFNIQETNPIQRLKLFINNTNSHKVHISSSNDNLKPDNLDEKVKLISN